MNWRKTSSAETPKPFKTSRGKIGPVNPGAARRRRVRVWTSYVPQRPATSPSPCALYPYLCVCMCDSVYGSTLPLLQCHLAMPLYYNFHLALTISQLASPPLRLVPEPLCES